MLLSLERAGNSCSQIILMEPWYPSFLSLFLVSYENLKIQKVKWCRDAYEFLLLAERIWRLCHRITISCAQLNEKPKGVEKRVAVAFLGFLKSRLICSSLCSLEFKRTDDWYEIGLYDCNCPVLSLLCLHRVWSIYDTLCFSALSGSRREGKQIRNCTFVFIVPRWKMAYEMTNPLIWSHFDFFFLFSKVYLLRLSKLKRERLKIERVHSFQSFKQMKAEQYLKKEMVPISNDRNGSSTWENNLGKTKQLAVV